MKAVTHAALFVCLFLLAPFPAWASEDSSTMAFPSCGSVMNRNSSHQFGEFNWLEYLVETIGSFDVCGQWYVRAEAYVVNIANSSATDTGIMYAIARRQVPVPVYGRVYQTNGRHYASATIPNVFDNGWWTTGNTVSYARVSAPVSSGNPAADCAALDGVWRDGWCDFKPTSPIIVNASGPYALTSPEEGVLFDLDADGRPERVAWTAADGDEEFLAMDRNGNGLIDDGRELFGNHTPAYPAEPVVTTANGFEALKFLESPSYGRSRPDRVLDAADAAFSRLLLWRDANHNGLSEPGELRLLSEAGISGISLDYTEKKRVDRYGNQFRQRGTIFRTDGSRDFAYDVWLLSRD